jgi:hypothetical protein
MFTDFQSQETFEHNYIVYTKGREEVVCFMVGESPKMMFGSYQMFDGECARVNVYFYDIDNE